MSILQFISAPVRCWQGVRLLPGYFRKSFHTNWNMTKCGSLQTHFTGYINRVCINGRTEAGSAFGLALANGGDMNRDSFNGRRHQNLTIFPNLRLHFRPNCWGTFWRRYWGCLYFPRSKTWGTIVVQPEDSWFICPVWSPIVWILSQRTVRPWQQLVSRYATSTFLSAPQHCACRHHSRSIRIQCCGYSFVSSLNLNLA
jgi:hypothetical protein